MISEKTTAFMYLNVPGVDLRGLSKLTDDEAEEIKREIKIGCDFYMETYSDLDSEGEVSAMIDLPEEMNQ